MSNPKRAQLDTAPMKQIAILKSNAKVTRDLTLYAAYHAIETEMKRLQAVARAAASVYDDASNDTAWSDLFEALFDAGYIGISEKNP